MLFKRSKLYDYVIKSRKKFNFHPFDKFEFQSSR